MADQVLKDKKNLIELLEYLAEHMKLFTYVVPAFNLKPGIRKCVEFFL
jgi:hypothetical protein